MSKSSSASSSRTRADQMARRHGAYDADRSWTVAAVLLVSLGVAVTYSRALRAPFIYDDSQSVLANPSIIRLWPLLGTDDEPGPLRPPRDNCTAGRPVVNLSLALNYYWGRRDPTGYHAVNFALHAIAALLLWSIVRRTLASPRWTDRWATVAEPMALAVALLWAVHPLATETVAYITQRTELIMAVCYLGTLYASVRYWDASSQRWRSIWLIVALLLCLTGMASKEVMVSAPLVVLLYEYTFRTGSLRAALVRSWPLYVALALGWVLLVVLNYAAPRSLSAGFHLGVPAHAWWFTQGEVLFMYLRLVAWPWPLSIHYEIPYLTTLAAAWPWLIAVALLLIATLVLLWRCSSVGFVLAAMFLVLAPTLIVPIITEVAAERRMYLPLAALLALAVVGCYSVVDYVLCNMLPMTDGDRRRRATLIATGTIATLLGAVYFTLDERRLSMYNDPVALWQDTYDLHPQSLVAATNLGLEMLNAGRSAEAISASRDALGRGLSGHGVHNNLAAALLKQGGTSGFKPGELDEAIQHLRFALRQKPDLADAHVNLALALLTSQQPDAAITECKQALELDPYNPRAMYAMGRILIAVGDRGQAKESFRGALAQDPSSAEAHYSLALLLLEEQQVQQAVAHLESALRCDPQLAEAHYALGGVSAAALDWSAAAGHYADAVALRPNYSRALNNLGVAQINLGQTEQAIRSFEEAMRHDPVYAEAKANLQRARGAQ